MDQKHTSGVFWLYPLYYLHLSTAKYNFSNKRLRTGCLLNSTEGTIFFLITQLWWSTTWRARIPFLGVLGYTAVPSRVPGTSHTKYLVGHTGRRHVPGEKIPAYGGEEASHVNF
jgi:hypothetical protein